MKTAATASDGAVAVADILVAATACIDYHVVLDGDCNYFGLMK